jgi:membrane-bound lytic murein transglycosylase D
MIILLFLNIFFCFLQASLLNFDKPYNLTQNQEYRSNDPDDALIKLILKDFENIINIEFKVPECLEQRVFFWSKVYGVYSSKEIIIHDRDDLSIIYKVLNYNKLWENKKLNQYQKILRMQKDINTERNKIRNIIKSLINKKTKLNEEEMHIFNLLKKQLNQKPRKEVFENALKNVRTQSGQKDFFKQGIISSGSYMEQIEKIFFEKNLPIELSRLSFVESSFNVNAVSKVGAKGLWQIMDETGDYYLELNKHIDERISPIKASRVAAKILKQDYRILKSWPLAVTAYNFGAARLRTASRIHKTKDLAYFIEHYKNPYFGFASKNFYASFLAALHIYTYYELLFNELVLNRTKNIDSVIIEKNLNINAISNILGLSIEEISIYNPDLKITVLNGSVDLKKGFEIKVPAYLTIKLLAYFVKYADIKDLNK